MEIREEKGERKERGGGDDGVTCGAVTLSCTNI